MERAWSEGCWPAAGSLREVEPEVDVVLRDAGGDLMGVRAGKLRPSQAVTQHGPGALVDLPTMSMIMLAADDWEIGQVAARRRTAPRASTGGPTLSGAAVLQP